MDAQEMLSNTMPLSMIYITLVRVNEDNAKFVGQGTWLHSNPCLCMTASKTDINTWNLNKGTVYSSVEQENYLLVEVHREDLYMFYKVQAHR